VAIDDLVPPEELQIRILEVVDVDEPTAITHKERQAAGSQRSAARTARRCARSS
jgi:hypothetical protein